MCVCIFFPFFFFRRCETTIVIRAFCTAPHAILMRIIAYVFQITRKIREGLSANDTIA